MRPHTSLAPPPRSQTSLALGLLALGLLALSAACAHHHRPDPIAQEDAQAVLDAQVARWNEGDLAGFVETYWDGPELTFFGRSGLTRGRADLLANYERGYPTPEARGVLSFEVVDYRPLGADHALLLGRYHLERQEPANGVFSLVLARRDGEIVILHDHSTASEDAPTPDAADPDDR